MPLASLRNVTIGYGGPPLLDGVDFSLDTGDRACLVGRNGEGKSTLLRLLSGEVEPDSGERVLGKGVRVGYMPQHMPADLRGQAGAIVEAGAPSDADASGVSVVGRILSMLGIDAGSLFEKMSGGQKRRVLLARALASAPDVLLLDEPTNHLDIESIEWLEGFLKRQTHAILFVTHDRMFLRRLATRIVDLDRGQLSDWCCDYDTFVRRKQALLDDEAVRNRRFDRKLSEEEAWIRQGIKARRTRDEGRVRALEEMRKARTARRETTGQVRLELQEAGQSGRMVIKAEGVCFGYGASAPVIQDFSVTLMRGDKVGVIGPNGCGKTTLLRLLLGPYGGLSGDAAPVSAPRVLNHRADAVHEVERPAHLVPQSGTVRHGTRLEVAYFDQHRHELDLGATVFENIGRGCDSVTINGKPRHVYSYLRDFLFTPDRARTPVHALSGGERNRLLLARLFAEPANLLVMDEPTNDLDAETLDLLEERLVEFAGTLLLVSHDREFLNNVVTSTLVFEGRGRIGEYVGGYDDWRRQRVVAEPEPGISEARVAVAVAGARARPRPRRLSYRETRDLAELPGRIEALEAEQATLHSTLADPATYQRVPLEVSGLVERSKALERELEAAYGRWAELESLAAECERG